MPRGPGGTSGKMPRYRVEFGAGAVAQDGTATMAAVARPVQMAALAPVIAKVARRSVQRLAKPNPRRESNERLSFA